MGQFHRGGQLCGSCEEGYSPLVYSYDLQCFNCTDSHYNWIEYVTAAFVPLTVFYVIILMCRVSATSPQLYAFVTFSQITAISANVRIILAAIANYPKIGTFVWINSSSVRCLEFGFLPYSHSTHLSWGKYLTGPSTRLCYCMLPSTFNSCFLRTHWASCSQLQTPCVSLEAIS